MLSMSHRLSTGTDVQVWFFYERITLCSACQCNLIRGQMGRKCEEGEQLQVLVESSFGQPAEKSVRGVMNKTK